MTLNPIKLLPIVGAIVLCGALAPHPAAAQGAQQNVAIAEVNVLQVSTGHRASKIVGSSIVNENNESIGKVDDVIVSDEGDVPYAVISVGGFLGIGDHLVIVPFEALQFGDKTVLPGATKDALKAMPEFKYASK
jgi:sporulation protein YlmC with PRC-barrel domain